MSCGSCAAFAATGAHETCMLKAGARMNGLDLSEQMIVDCGYNGQDMNGCHGAHSGSYGRVFAGKLAGQSPHEATYPYLDTQPKLSCPSGVSVYNSGASVKTPMEDYSCSEAKLMQQVRCFCSYKYYPSPNDIIESNNQWINFIGLNLWCCCLLHLCQWWIFWQLWWWSLQWLLKNWDQPCCSGCWLWYWKWTRLLAGQELLGYKLGQEWYDQDCSWKKHVRNWQILLCCSVWEDRWKALRSPSDPSPKAHSTPAGMRSLQDLPWP